MRPRDVQVAFEDWQELMMSSRNPRRAFRRLPVEVSTPTPSSAIVIAATAGSSSSAISASRSSTDRSTPMRTLVSSRTSVRSAPPPVGRFLGRSLRLSRPDRFGAGAGVPSFRHPRRRRPARAARRLDHDERSCTAHHDARLRRADRRNASTLLSRSPQSRVQNYQISSSTNSARLRRSDQPVK